ncbi:MAG: hypothetical protein WAO69_16395, partial [Aestuariivita sp.]
MGNALAQLMLIIWPAVCVAFFTRLSVERALIWSIVGAYMLLPPRTEFDLPLIPSLDKFSIPSISALVIIVLFLGLRPSFWPRHRITRVLIVSMLMGTVFSVVTNTDPILFNQRVDALPISFPSGFLPGLRLIDVLSILSSQLIMLIPFFLARQYLSSDTGLRELMYALVIAGLIYSIHRSERRAATRRRGHDRDAPPAIGPDRAHQTRAQQIKAFGNGICAEIFDQGRCRT